MTDTHRYCVICGIDISDKRSAAKTCSPKCRKLASRKRVTHNMAVTPAVTPEDLWFEFTVKAKDDEKGGKKRQAKYWYDVPLAAQPVLREGWPEMPDYMNGRQYFLWWKNEFKVGTGKSPFDGPVLFNPFPKRDNITYVQAGEGSRRWGA